MYLSAVALFVLSQLVSVRAQATEGYDAMSSPAKGSTYTIGGTVPIVWAPEKSTGTVTIYLIGGPTDRSLMVLDTVVSKIDSQTGSYNYTIPSKAGAFATYGFNLTHDQGPEFQYSYAFYITGGEDGTATNGTSTTVISTSSTSASGSGSVSTSTTGTGGSTIVIHTPSATTSSPAGTATTTSVGTTAASNGTASKTSSAKSSGTSSASTTSSTIKPNGASLKVVSGSLALLSAFVFAFAL